MPERVLVLPRGNVPGGCDFRGVRQADADALTVLRDAVASHGRYLDRPLAEDDPSHKLLIPYVVVRDGSRVFLMERTDAGGDARLHGKASIGVGGHLNPVDEGEDALMAGLRREWAEELEADWQPHFELVGLLNDDANPVGAVHLGVVFTVEADGRAVAVREHEKLIGRFVEPAEVGRAWDRLENWSQVVAASLGIAIRTAT
jgi:predicted NUDIX family phosphoesterase